jgi:TetR/AcrR family transcriptional regulator
MTYGQAGAERTRAALLEAGLALFARKGYDGTRVEEIAARAGVNKAMINYHFRGKKGLHSAILESVFTRVNRSISALPDSKLPPATQMRDYIELVAGVMRGHPDLPAMVLREALSGGRHMEPQVLEHIRGVFGSVRRILEKGSSVGDFRPVEPLAAFLLLQSSLAFFFATTAFRERILADEGASLALPADSFVAQIQELYLHGLLARDRSGGDTGSPI